MALVMWGMGLSGLVRVSRWLGNAALLGPAALDL